MIGFFAFFLLFFSFVFAQNTDWYNTTDTEFGISTYDQLRGLAELVNNGTDDFDGKTIKLKTNINITSTINFVPIGVNESGPFKGIFDGNYKKITNLKINRTGNGNRVGFFGYIASSGTVKNLGLENVNITGDGYIAGTGDVGGVAGSNFGTITDCYVTGVINGNGDGAGGIVGFNEHGGIIKNCYSTALITARNYAGGIAGPSNSYKINGCAALNPEILHITGGKGKYIGRVMATEGGSNCACSDNVAFAEMLVMGSTIEGGTATDKNGMPKTLDELQVASGFPEALTQSPWVYEPGKLPGFGIPVDMPPHLLTEAGKRNITNATVKLSPNSFIYSNDEKEPSITVDLLSARLTENDDYTVAYESNKNAGTAYIIITATEGSIYNGKKTLTFEIAKAAGAAVATPTFKSKTANSIIVNIVEAPESEQEVEYAINTDNTAPTKTNAWKTASPIVFESLISNTDYFIFARAKENDNYNAGVASKALSVKTDAVSSSSNEEQSSSSVPHSSSSTETLSSSSAKTLSSSSSEIQTSIIDNVILLSNLPPRVNIEIYNLSGECIYRGNSKNSQILVIPVLTKGLYIAKVTYGSEKRILKVIAK